MRFLFGLISLLVLSGGAWAQVGTLSPLDVSEILIDRVDLHYRLGRPDGQLDFQALLKNPDQEIQAAAFLLVSGAREVELLADGQPLEVQTVERGPFFGHGFNLELAPGKQIRLTARLAVSGVPVTTLKGRCFRYRVRFPHLQEGELLVDCPTTVWVAGLDKVGDGRWAYRPKSDDSFHFEAGPTSEVGMLAGFGVPLVVSLVCGLVFYARKTGLLVTILVTAAISALSYWLVSAHPLFLWSTEAIKEPLLITLSLAAVPRGRGYSLRQYRVTPVTKTVWSV